MRNEREMSGKHVRNWQGSRIGSEPDKNKMGIQTEQTSGSDKGGILQGKIRANGTGSNV